MARMAAGVRKKDNGRYEKRFTIDGQRFSVSGSSSKECVEKEQQVRQQVAEGSYSSNKDITLSKYFQEWEASREGIIKISTLNANRSRFERHIEPELGSCKIQKIERRQVLTLQKKLSERLKPSTVNLSMTTLKTILSAAVDDEIISKNVALTVKSLRTDGQVKASESIHRALTTTEQAFFLEAIQNEWMYEFTYFSLCTGMRIMEVGALTWADIDYINNCIHVTKTLSLDEKNHVFLVTSPKSETSIRDIPMNDTIKKILTKQKEKMMMVFGGKALKKDSRIFTGQNGGVIQSSPFRGMVKRAIKRIEKEHEVKIEVFSHHSMRSTFATRYIEAGGNMQTLKTILGHSSLELTADLYSHVMESTKQAEMNMVESAFAL